MSDDLDIRGGGAVAVDTTTLRSAAVGFASLAADLEEVCAMIGSAALCLFDISHENASLSYEAGLVRRRVDSVGEEAQCIAESLRAVATVYEIVELRAERAAAGAAGDAVALARIDARLEALIREHPEAARKATREMVAHARALPAELASQAAGVLSWLGPGFGSIALPMVWSLQNAVGAWGAGTVPASARLAGPAKDVTIERVPTRGPERAPSSLAQATARIPGRADARIRVERYEMRDGSRQFAVYVAGTQSFRPGTSEAFDMASNVELYSGERSASYEATRAALERAGAREGDVVHAFGHSQGAMVTARLALEGEFDVRTLVSVGSPVEADVGDHTLSVTLRHVDDPVPALVGAGHGASVGAPGSFVAERTADPAVGLHDIRFPAHGIEGYTQTAHLLDTSGDPRMGAVREVFDELGGAESVEVAEYSAQRVLAPAVPRPEPGSAPLSPGSSGAG